MIPLLRCSDAKDKKTHTRRRSTALLHKKRERAWDKYMQPISGYNESVHSSFKIKFEQI